MEFNKIKTISALKKWVPRIFISYFLICFIWVIAYKWINPPGTLLMLNRQFESDNKAIYYNWVDYDNISAFIKVCAIASEDQNFPFHYGLDLMAIQKAVEFNKSHKRIRGASTITQQVAKNVFLWPGRSFLRKIFEVQFTILIEILWSKKRILEVYLNVIEMGKNTFGVDSASKIYFHKKAEKLSLDESARIISILPSPIKWSATRPGPYLIKRQNWIKDQFYALGGITYLNEI